MKIIAVTCVFIIAIGFVMYRYSKNIKIIDTVSVIDVELFSLVAAVKQYQVEYSTLPKGNEAQISTALRGDNPKKLLFIDWPTKSIDMEGRLLDPWGTPIKILISNNIVTVTSAGKNTKFGDSDDKSRTSDLSR
jgi:hypothetical protein